MTLDDIETELAKQLGKPIAPNILEACLYVVGIIDRENPEKLCVNCGARPAKLCNGCLNGLTEFFGFNGDLANLEQVYQRSIKDNPALEQKLRESFERWLGKPLTNGLPSRESKGE